VAADAAGNVYVAGDADYANPYYVNYWTVRKGIGGTNFSTVDSLQTGSTFPTAQAILAHPTAGIFAAGEASVVVNKFGGTALEWVVRRSTNGGITWSTVDTFAFTNSSSIYRADAHGIGADSLGNVYVVGRAANKNKSDGIFHWLVRKGVKGGTSWTTVDDYEPYSSGTQSAERFIAGPNGDLYAVGGAGPASGPSHWIVRWNPVGTSTWSTVDDYTYVPGGSAWAFTMAANASGNVFVGGGGSGTSEHWVVRKR